MVLTKKTGTNLESQLLEVRHMPRPHVLLPWLTKVCFKTDVFERVWPPLEFEKYSKFQNFTGDTDHFIRIYRIMKPKDVIHVMNWTWKH